MTITMKPRLLLEFHVHSDRSHDSAVPIERYVEYLERNLPGGERAVLGISDHNVIPITMKEALAYSTEKVLVIPGIQWKLKKRFVDAVFKLVARRELLTFGDHDNLRDYVKKRTNYTILKNDEIFGNLTETEFLDYIAKKREMVLIVPHPKHFVVDYYGKKQIRKLESEIEEEHVKAPLLVEEKTGYDPFPRILCSYKGKYPIIGDPDAHEIYSILHTKSLFSVEATLPLTENLTKTWQGAIRREDLAHYRRTLDTIFKLIVEHNSEMIIKKHYLRAYLQFLHSVPRFVIRRFENFPHNVLR